MTKRFRVRLLPKAKAELEIIERWWALHRKEHPDLVSEELAEAADTLATAPDAGLEYSPRLRPGMRRIMLPRSRYHLYYRVLREERSVEIVAVWFAGRAKGPPLR
jgi:plasmid stabilization system protein ParE